MAEYSGLERKTAWADRLPLLGWGERAAAQLGLQRPVRRRFKHGGRLDDGEVRRVDGDLRNREKSQVSVLAIFALEGEGQPKLKNEAANAGNVLAYGMAELVELCVELGLPSIQGFVFDGASELDEHIEEELSIYEDEDPEEYRRHFYSMGEWYDSAEGLRCVAGLLAHLEAHPELTQAERLQSLQEVKFDLSVFKALLENAAARGKRFRLEMY